MEDSPKPPATWKAVLGWVLVGIAVLGSIVAGLSSGSPGVAGYIIGRAYSWTILIIVVLIFVRRRQSPNFKANVTLVAGALIFGLHAWYGHQGFLAGTEDREFGLAKAETQRIGTAAMQEISAISAGQIDAPPSATWRPYVEPESQVELGDASVPLHLRVVELARRERVRQVEFTRQSARAGLDSGVEIVLDHARLLKPQERRAALVRMEGYRDHLNSFERRLAQSSALYHADLRDLGLPQASEQEIKAGYDRKAAETVESARDMIRQELLTLDQAEKMVQLVESQGESVRLAGGSLKFADFAVQSEYDGLRKELGLAGPES